MSIWMKNNKLKLNDDKTDLLVLTAGHCPQPPIESIVVGSDLIFPSETVKNLRTVFDTSLSLEKESHRSLQSRLLPHSKHCTR